MISYSTTNAMLRSPKEIEYKQINHKTKRFSGNEFAIP